MKRIKHPSFIVLGLITVLVICACLIKANVIDLQIMQQQEQAQEQTEEQTVMLTEKEQQSLGSYSQEMNDIAQVLQSNIWASPSTGSSLSFTDRSVVQTSSSGETKESSFVLTASESRTQPNNDSTTNFVYTFGVSIAGKDTLGTLTQTRQNGTGEASDEWSLNCDGLEYAQTYERSEANIEIDLSGFPSQASDLIGGSEGIDDLNQVLSAYCSVNYPDTTSARFAGKMTIDWTTSVIDLPLTLEGQSSATLTAHYDMNQKIFYFGSQEPTSN